MDVLILQSSPNLDGLTAACARAAAAGAHSAGAQVEDVRLNDLEILPCQACGSGWGSCLPSHGCQVIDDFQLLHARVLQADALFLVTPVYWGEMSEVAKSFMDRLRRCEATNREASPLKGKPLLAVAAAGGSGNGTVSCLAAIERWAQHTGMHIWDLIAVRRWSRDYQLEAISAAALACAGSLESND